VEAKPTPMSNATWYAADARTTWLIFWLGTEWTCLFDWTVCTRKQSGCDHGVVGGVPG